MTGLASFAPEGGNSAIGPHGVFVKGGLLYVTNGGPTAPMRNGQLVLRDPTLVSEDPISALYGTLLRVRKHGRASQIADLWAFENENNPDEEEGNELVDSNPVDVLAAHGNRLYVADAGGNTILRVSRGGTIRVVSLFPNIQTPNPFGGPDVDMNAVPTGVVAGRDGALYVNQLTGFRSRSAARRSSASIRAAATSRPTRAASRTPWTSTSAATARSTCSRSTATRYSIRWGPERAASGPCHPAVGRPRRSHCPPAR